MKLTNFINGGGKLTLKKLWPDSELLCGSCGGGGRRGGGSRALSAGVVSSKYTQQARECKHSVGLSHCNTVTL